MSSMFKRYSIVIPVFNQLQYTAQCVESLIAQNVKPTDILIIDNASADDTPMWLEQHPEVRRFRNESNLGCGCAWTQGVVLSPDAEWIVLLNNDVLAGPDAINALIDAAERASLSVVSPALLEGRDDYGFEAFSREYVGKMAGMVRRGRVHGVCFAIHRSVIEKVGFPDTDRRLGGYEDAEYQFRCRRAGIAVGTVGDSVFHHFGSITQKAIKQATGQKSLGDLKYFRTRVGSGWLSRKRDKFISRKEFHQWITAETASSSYSLHMQRKDGGWELH